MKDPVELPDAKSAEASALAWAQADSSLGALLQKGLSLPSALVQWGAGLYRAGRAQDAVIAFRAALGLAPSNATAWTNLAIALGAIGDLEAAKGCFVRALEASEGDADTWILLGMAREREGDLAGAEHDYRHAAAIDPNAATTWKVLGALLQKRRDPKGAAQAFRQALALDPDDAAVSASLGKALYEDGNMDEALAAYTAATSNDRDNAHFLRMARCAELASALIAGARAEDALATLDAQGPLTDEERADIVAGTAAALTRFGHHDASLRLAKRRTEL